MYAIRSYYVLENCSIESNLSMYSANNVAFSKSRFLYPFLVGVKMNTIKSPIEISPITIRFLFLFNWRFKSFTISEYPIQVNRRIKKYTITNPIFILIFTQLFYFAVRLFQAVLS